MKVFFKASIYSFLLTIILIAVLSILISYTSLPENIIFPAIIVISSFSIMVAGIVVSKSKKEKGIINGGIVGIIYMLLIYIMSVFLTLDFSLTSNSLIMILFGTFGGMLGGIIGVNLK